MDFTEFVKKVIVEAVPLGQNSTVDNLGLGWMYYSLVRIIRPKFVVAIGSCRGFMPLCAARAAQDNEYGKVIFVDPSLSYITECKDFWSDPDKVNDWFANFELTDWIMHLKETSEEAVPHVKKIIGKAKLGLVIIDGWHSYEQSLQDFEEYSKLTDGFVLFHDPIEKDRGVRYTIDVLKKRGYQLITLGYDGGLSMVKTPMKSNDKSKYDETTNYFSNEVSDEVWRLTEELKQKNETITQHLEEKIKKKMSKYLQKQDEGYKKSFIIKMGNAYEKIRGK